MKIKIDLYADHVLKDASWEVTAKEYYKTNAIRKELAKREALLSSRLKTLSDNKSARGGNFAFSKSKRLGLVDYKAIVIEQLPDLNLEAYRKDETYSWKITKL